VTEPVIPPLCTALDAKLAAMLPGRTSRWLPADEAKTRTPTALDSARQPVRKGQAVALRIHGSANAFVSGR